MEKIVYVMLYRYSTTPLTMDLSYYIKNPDCIIEYYQNYKGSGWRYRNNEELIELPVLVDIVGCSVSEENRFQMGLVLECNIDIELLFAIQKHWFKSMRLEYKNINSFSRDPMKVTLQY